MLCNLIKARINYLTIFVLTFGDSLTYDLELQNKLVNMGQ